MDKIDALLDRLVGAYAPTPQKKQMIRSNILKQDASISQSEIFNRTAVIFDNAFAVFNEFSYFNNAAAI